MSQIDLKNLWVEFEKVLCLTLNNEIDRQKSATKELCDIGLEKFQFFEGVDKDNERVKKIYSENKVLNSLHVFVVVKWTANALIMY